MINKITDSICEAIYKEFGDEYEIYTEEVEQGLKEPCFSIICINSTHELFKRSRYFKQHQFCVHYFPSTEEKRTECFNVLDRLYNCLEYIEIKEEAEKSKVRGSDMNGEYSDSILNFFVNYNMFMNKNEEATKMDSYECDTNVVER